MSGARRVIARDCTALVLWATALVVLAGVAAASLAVVHGRAASAWEAVVLAVAWIVAAGFAASALATPCTRAEIAPDGTVTFTRRYPHKRLRESWAAADLSAPAVTEKVDSDGDRHHSAVLVLPDGRDFVLCQPVLRSGSEGSQARNRQRCEAACARFGAALAKARDRGPGPQG